VRELRWAKPLPFNPVSPQQVLAYLKFRGYKIPTARKANAKGVRPPTTNDEALSQILRNNVDPLLELVLEARGLRKALGYLLDTALGSDGRFHPIYTFRPETGRLSSVRPNMQNVPKGGVDAELSRAIRSCITPSRPGRVLLECDWKAMEAVLTGCFAGDPEYIAASQKDSHSWFAGYLLQAQGVLKEVPSPTSADFLTFASWVKKEHKELRALAKKVNLATGYGMRAPLLASTLHCTIAEAKRYLEIKALMAPKLEAWKQATWREAHNKGYLETPFGYINYFWDVLNIRDGKATLGKEANAALAFRPQSSGASMLREVMLHLDAWDGELFDLLVPIHDAILVECDEGNVERAKDVICSAMGRAWPELGGLVIEAEATAGVRWSDMEEVD
jgi:DNA polymerase I